jgi:hypothetical protein
MKEALGNASAYAVLKPKFEQLCGALGKDPHLILKAQETLGELYSEAMAKNQKINTKTDGTYGMQSFPATDRASKSKRLESAPTVNTAAGKKRAAKKQPPL